tara:strand:+ start:13 stop:612 length:600 start_codon:yes stop_codon:yes gene_type:complete
VKRLVVAITGASGALYGYRLISLLNTIEDVEIHLVISDAGALTLNQELGIKKKDLENLAYNTYNIKEVGACIASGSFQSDGMIVAPCSMKTLASIANGLCENLISRAADVILKERRKLVLMIRETPFNLAHIKNMKYVTEMGGIIYPPLPAFYQKPKNIEQMVDDTLKRIIDIFFSLKISKQWMGVQENLKDSKVLKNT